jgi:glucokinase
MATQILAGDIGGTKTALTLHTVGDDGATTQVREQSFPSREYAGLEQVISAFLRAGEIVAGAAFGIAGPIVDDAVTTTNLPWRIERRSLSEQLGGVPVVMMNDLESTAYGALFLQEDELLSLNVGVPRPGHRAVIAAGTGLGEALLHWDGRVHSPVATEGGHADFAPRTELEDRLLTFLRRRFGPHVSSERVVSGPGLHNVFQFLDEELRRPVAPEIRARMALEDPSAVVGEAAVAGTCATCQEAVDLFLDAYGARAGNLALTAMATGGMYVGGGIVTKLIPLVRDSGFMRTFVAKGRYQGLMSEIPVRVILNPRTALIGATRAAAALVHR